MAVEVGAEAPDFTLPDQHLQQISLAGFRGAKNVLVVFYPFSFTRVCTGEMCEIRDNLAEFESHDVEVLAISCDAPATQRVFAETEHLDFRVLSDFWPHGAAAVAYGVFDEKRGAARRGTFLVDRSGVVRWQVVNDIPDARNLDDYRKALADL